MTPIRPILSCAAVVVALSCAPAVASQNLIERGARAVCAAKSVADMSAALANFGPVGEFSDEKVAEAFGEALFLADLGRCVSPQAIVDAYAAFKQGKDGQTLDVAFAEGHMNGAPDGDSEHHGSNDHDHDHDHGDHGDHGLGGAGDPPSGH